MLPQDFTDIGMALAQKYAIASTSLRLDLMATAKEDLRAHLEKIGPMLLDAYADGRRDQREADSDDYQRSVLAEHTGMQIPGGH